MTDDVPKIRRALDAADKAALDEAPEIDEEEFDVKGSVTERMRQRASEQAGGSVSDLKQDWQASAIPGDLTVPKGEEVYIMKFEADLVKATCRHKGDRTAVLWGLSVADERTARQRMFGDPTRGLEEMAKMMIRAIDGHPIKAADPTEVERFWDEIGPRYRNMIVSWYQRTHNFDEKERLLFFGTCVAVRTAR